MHLLSPKEIKEQISLIDSWQIDLGLLCKEIHHHPIITNNYLLVIIKLTTKDVGGLSQKDFDLAKLIDQISL